MVKVDTVSSIPRKDAIDSEWIVWHKAMKDEFGKKQANLYFLKAWKQRNTDGFILDGKANTVVLREYLQKEGIQVEKGAMSYVADGLDDTLDGFFSMFGTASKMALVALLIVFLLAVWVIIRIVRNPNEYQQLIATLASRGMIR
ncbi:hypothetical protein Q0590_25125 [Rhodocytophaga aerolata]|uniref:Uncharacterized protein n=1 Tax=Rhodocytophaga aerolata TaxID=455078 RepID=A0ABT8RC53_9BACT|nr:hypothetical protein [Rhodocytophaga aerolata]MDO1449584.1 hypothetical protein [Rhodocytophaga aerolata]